MKTSKLTGAALDWAVAKCAWEPERVFLYGEPVKHVRVANRPDIAHEYNLSIYYTPSTDWGQGGPIIEREELSIEPQYTSGGLECWVSYGHNLRYNDHGNYIQGSDNRQYATTPLIAAMRCYVASKLGDEVEIPQELL
jgi:hypothetical protein